MRVYHGPAIVYGKKNNKTLPTDPCTAFYNQTNNINDISFKVIDESQFESYVVLPTRPPKRAWAGVSRNLTFKDDLDTLKDIFVTGWGQTGMGQYRKEPAETCSIEDNSYVFSKHPEFGRLREVEV